MVFMKKGEGDRRKKAAAQIKTVNEKKRVKKARLQGEIVPAGRRIVDLALIAQSMWCSNCDVPLSFRFMEEETLIGAASIFKIRCHQCLVMHEVHSSTSLPNTTSPRRPLQAINCKFALGCIDSGVGHEQLNKLLSAVNLPIIHRNTIKLAEDRVGESVLSVADESCREAIQMEKRLSVSERNDREEPMDVDNPPSPTTSSGNEAIPETPKTSRPRRNSMSSSAKIRASTSASTSELPPEYLNECHPDPPPGTTVNIVVKYDFGWDKRGNGFKYDSHSGRGSMIGEKTNKILGYRVLSSYCYMCSRGLKQENHVCAKNYEGSAKGMEPKAAVDLIVKNPDLRNAGVRVSAVIGDKDSSTAAALRKESPHPIRKILDVNHNVKCVNNQLYKLKKGQHKFLTSETINYIKRCLCYAIAQNAGNVEAVRAAIKNISCHVFGEHANCSPKWCHAKNIPNYRFKHLPGHKPLSDAAFRVDLDVILNEQADQAEQLAPHGFSLQNESFNHMCNTRAPKSRHYSGTQALVFRVASAVTTKNYGVEEGLERTFQKVGLSPSVRRHRKSMEARRVWKASHQNQPEVKKRRLHLKMRDTWKESAASQKEGYTYVSGMSITMERAAEASAVQSWLPDPTPLLPTCLPVIVDIETTGFGADAEIVQIAAKCGDQEFNTFMVPRGKFDEGASRVTGMTVEGGRLLRHGESLPTVPTCEAVRSFVDFLKSCSSQVFLVGHNIVRFDGPRIMKICAELDIAKELCAVTFGLTDTLPLISQGKVKKQDVLADTYLTAQKWRELKKTAHDALTDCCLLEGLLDHFKVTNEDLLLAVLPIRDFMERCAANKKKKRNLPKLMVMQAHGVSKGMISKMAAEGVTIEELVSAHTKDGRKGLEVCLGVQLGGKPRVSKCKKVIDQIEQFVKTRL